MTRLEELEDGILSGTETSIGKDTVAIFEDHVKD